MDSVTPEASPSISLQSVTLFIQLFCWRESLSRHPGVITGVTVPTLSRTAPRDKHSLMTNQVSAQGETGLLMRNEAEEITSLLTQSQRPQWQSERGSLMNKVSRRVTKPTGVTHHRALIFVAE